MRTALVVDSYVPREGTRPSLYVADGLSAARLAEACVLIDDHALDVVARAAIGQRGAAPDSIVGEFLRFHRDELALDVELADLALVGLGARYGFRDGLQPGHQRAARRRVRCRRPGARHHPRELTRSLANNTRRPAQFQACR